MGVYQKDLLLNMRWETVPMLKSRIEDWGFFTIEPTNLFPREQL